jgi:hypothetical protein
VTLHVLCEYSAERGSGRSHLTAGNQPAHLEPRRPLRNAFATCRRLPFPAGARRTMPTAAGSHPSVSTRSRFCSVPGRVIRTAGLASIRSSSSANLHSVENERGGPVRYDRRAAGGDRLDELPHVPPGYVLDRPLPSGGQDFGSRIRGRLPSSSFVTLGADLCDSLPNRRRSRRAGSPASRPPGRRSSTRSGSPPGRGLAHPPG